MLRQSKQRLAALPALLAVILLAACVAAPATHSGPNHAAEIGTHSFRRHLGKGESGR